MKRFITGPLNAKNATAAAATTTPAQAAMIIPALFFFFIGVTAAAAAPMGISDNAAGAEGAAGKGMGSTVGATPVLPE